MRKVYIIHSEYNQNGMTFNSTDRYAASQENADRIYESTLAAMKADNPDMLRDRQNYKTNYSNRKGNRFFYCFYRQRPTVSNFQVEMRTERLED